MEKINYMKNFKKSKNIGILGFGNMGQIIFSLLREELNNNFFIHSLGITKISGAKCLKDAQELFDKSDIVFICIKPQDFYNLPAIKINNSKLILISIMAGVKVKNISRIFGTNKIIRAMPNLALRVRKSVIGWCANEKFINSSELKMIRSIFSKFGESLYFKNESMLDSVTAISGSGPAYVFLFIDALEKAAKKIGFDEKSAREAVIKTIEGSIAYIRNEKNVNLEKLIARVKSKKGTTEAALEEINATNFYSLWQRAIQKAKKRSEELSSYEIK